MWWCVLDYSTWSCHPSYKETPSISPALKKQTNLLSASIWRRSYGNKLRVAYDQQPGRKKDLCPARSGSFQNHTSDETLALVDMLIASLWDLEAKDWGKQCPESWTTETDIINVSVFKHLNLWQYCYKAVDNQYLEERLISFL